MAEADRQAAYARGLDAETRAARFLAEQGFTERGRRVKMKGGEIDLIVEDEETIVLVEVKARKTITEGVEAVTWRQQARIRSALHEWLAREADADATLLTRTIRCDVVVVAPNAPILHIDNAFPAAS